MGNCLRSHVKIVQIVKPDGKILEYKASIKVNEVLSEFKGYGLSDNLPILQYLKPNLELMAGRMYYLAPLPAQSPKCGKKKVRFAEPEKVDEKKSEDISSKDESKSTEDTSLKDERKSESTSLTVKLVISKQELKEMLENGVFSLDELVLKKQRDSLSAAEMVLDEQSSESQIWMPALKSIPELE